MTRLQRIAMPALLMMIALPGCGGDDVEDGRPVATAADTFDSRTWQLVQDDWAALVEKAKSRIPEAEAGRNHVTRGKQTIKVKSIEGGMPGEFPTFNSDDLPEKIVLAKVAIKIQEEVEKKGSREVDYEVSYVWNENQWNFFEGFATLASSTLPDTGQPGEQVGVPVRIESVDTETYLKWLLGPPLSSEAKFALGLSDEPPDGLKGGKISIPLQ